MALVGDNGAGKSTLIKCVAGIHPFDCGRDLLRRRARAHPRAEGRGAARDRGRLPGSRALRQPRRRPEHVPRPRGARPAAPAQRDRRWRRRRRRRSKSLAVTTIRSIRQRVATLSGGQRQSVAVARAVMWNSRLVVLDEPTAALGVAQTRQVLELVKRLAQQGLAVVIISHNLHDIFEVATGSPCSGWAATSGSSIAPRRPRGGRACDHGRRCDEGRRHRRHRRGRDGVTADAPVCGTAAGRAAGRAC